MQEGVEDEWNPGWYAAFVETLVLLPRVLDLQLPVVSPLVEDLHMRNEVTQTGFNPILQTWFRDSCFTCDPNIQAFPLIFYIGMVY